MWSRSAAVSETTFAKSDILLEVRFEATFRVPLPMYRWIVLVSTCQVEACSSRVIHTAVPPYNRTRTSSPCLHVFLFVCLFVCFSCEFDFLVNTFAWSRNRGDSFSFCIGKPFPTEKRLLVVSWPPTVWPNMIWWCSHRGLYSYCCLDYFYVPDFGCRLCTGREQHFAVLRWTWNNRSTSKSVFCIQRERWLFVSPVYGLYQTNKKALAAGLWSRERGEWTNFAFVSSV